MAGARGGVECAGAAGVEHAGGVGARGGAGRGGGRAGRRRSLPHKRIARAAGGGGA